MTFVSNFTGLIKVGEEGVRNFTSAFFGEDVPEEHRLTEYKITDIRLIAGDQEEFCIAVISNYRTTGLGWLSASGSFQAVDDGYLCEGDYREYRIKYLKGSLYQIIGIGTGGGAQDLTPVDQATNPEQPGVTELDRIARNLLDRNYDVLRIYLLAILPLEGVPMEPKPGEHIFPVKDDRFKTFADLEAFIRSTYVKEQADAVLNDGRYMDVDGRLHGDLHMYGGMGYFTDWVNYRLTLSEVTPDSAFITMKTGSHTGIGPDEIILTVSMKQVNGQWLLERMIY